MAYFRRFGVKEPRHSETIHFRRKVLPGTSIVAFVKDLDGCIFPLLGGVSRSPHVDKQVVQVADKFGVVMCNVASF